VQQALRAEFADRGKVHQFDKLQAFLDGGNREDSLAAIAAQLSMSEVAVKVSVHRLRQRFGQLLRAEIEQTVSTPDDIDVEIRELFEILQK
jgi:RNA polymerase sigma-70 factor (ECF subfamily)